VLDFHDEASESMQERQRKKLQQFHQKQQERKLRLQSQSRERMQKVQEQIETAKSVLPKPEQKQAPKEEEKADSAIQNQKKTPRSTSKSKLLPKQAYQKLSNKKNIRNALA
jgi:hypothetical protein